MKPAFILDLCALLHVWMYDMHINDANTLRSRRNGRHFPWHFQMHFCEWKCMNLDKNFQNGAALKFVPKGPVNSIPALVQIMAWRRPGAKPVSESMMVSLLTHIYASPGLDELNCWVWKWRVREMCRQWFWWPVECATWVVTWTRVDLLPIGPWRTTPSSTTAVKFPSKFRNFTQRNGSEIPWAHESLNNC